MAVTLQAPTMLTHAQRCLLAERDDPSDAALVAHAVALARRAALMAERRTVRALDQGLLRRRLEGVAAGLADDLRDDAARAAVWTAVEELTRRPWGPGAAGAIDRLVVAGAIADALAGG